MGSRGDHGDTWSLISADTPFGLIRGLVSGDKVGLTSMKMISTDEFLTWGQQWLSDNHSIDATGSNGQAGETFHYDIDRLLDGQNAHLKPDLSRNTPFQVQVAEVVSKIPFGETASYGEIAVLLGKPGGAQAVGQALPKLPFALFLPTHRVVRTTGIPVGCTLLTFELKTGLLQWEQDRAKQLSPT